MNTFEISLIRTLTPRVNPYGVASDLEQWADTLNDGCISFTLFELETLTEIIEMLKTLKNELERFCSV